jgi:putative intracellular protease/amidase
MRVLLIVASDCGEDVTPTIEQIAGPYFRLRDSGLEIVLASPGGGEPILANTRSARSELVLRFRNDRLAREALTDTLRLDQVFAEDFAAAFCVGDPKLLPGAGGERASTLISELLANGRPVAVVSAGLNAGLMITGTAPILAANALIGALAE